MNRSLRLLITFGLAAIFLFGCEPVGNWLSRFPSGTPNPVLFKDDFSDHSSGWRVLGNLNTLVGYDQDRFRFLIAQPGITAWSTPRVKLQDVRIEVDASKLSGPDDNEFGILCRYQDENNYYSLVISSNGYYGISKTQNGQRSALGADGMRVSQSIQQGGSTNHLVALCSGNTLVLSVNGEQLLETQDSSFTRGDVGLVAGAANTPGVDIAFDNFIVTRPEQETP